MDSTLNKFLSESFGIAANANDLFGYARAESILIAYDDLAWVLPIYEKYNQDVMNAVLSYIAQKPVINECITDNFTLAFNELINLNPDVVSEY
jgi:hypothetical protein